MVRARQRYEQVQKLKAEGKFLKRLMFGRANYDLLRKMALLN